VFTLEVAELMSTLVASEPLVRPAPVRVRVVASQTLAGSEVIELVMVARSEPIDVEAVPTMLLVFPFTTAAREVDAVVTVVDRVATCEFVLVFTLAVPAVIAEPSEVEAVVTSDWSASEPEESPAPVSVRVAAAHTLVGMLPIELVIVARSDPIEDEAVFVTLLTLAATEVEAVPTMLLVLVFTLDVAELISTLVASEPTLRPAPVRVRVAAAQTLVGIEVMEDVIVARSEPIEDEAVLVLLFTLAATEVEAFVTVVESVPI